MFLTIVIFILVLSVLVFAHEFGHFWTARKAGVKAEEFGIGLPPRIWGVYKSKEGKWKQVRGKKEVTDAADTVYSINCLPIGGFVKIKGEDGEGSDEKDNINSKTVGQRMMIFSAGVVMNVVLAMFLFSIGYMIGLPQGTDGVDPKAIVSEQMVQISSVAPDSPAEKAGIKSVDIVMSVNGALVRSDIELQELTRTHAGEELEYVIKRGDDLMSFKVTPELNEEGNAVIGIAIVNLGLVRYPWYIAIWKGITTAIMMLWFIIVAFAGLFKGIFMGQGVPSDVSGPVGIATMTGQFARMGFSYLLQFTAVLSINLAVINFLPLPALDGGRVLFLLIEKIKGSPVKREVEGTIHNIGFMALMLLIVIITVRDVAKHSGVFVALWEKIF